MNKLILLFLIVFISCSPHPKDNWVDNALTQAHLQAIRMAKSIKDQPGQLPRSANRDEKLITSSSDWWCSGFYPGVLWLLYENTGDPELLQYASEFTNRLNKEQFNTSTHDLGFMLYCSYGNALRITGNDSIKNVLLNGARSLSSRYKDTVGCIQSWGSSERWRYPVIIDNMMNLEMLMWAYKESGDDKFREISIMHSDKTMKNHFRPDNSSYHVLSYNPENGEVEFKGTDQGYSDESAWARGQAWGLYGYTMMFRESGNPKYLEHAHKIASFILNHPNLPEDKIPYWDFNSPKIPDDWRDSSSAAIIASAFLELSTYSDKATAKIYFEVAEKQLRMLASPEYTAEIGSNANFILKHGVGNIPQNSEIDAPLSYGDYYYIEALLRYKNYNQGNYKAFPSELPNHPRLLLSGGEEKKLLKQLSAGNNTGIMLLHNNILSECDRIINLPVLERKKIGMRLLATSREALRRIFFLSYAYRMTEEDKYLVRAEKEMLAVSAFTDWNPTHFLDVAEMTMAVSIGYDWLFKKLSEDSRSIIREAIINKGLEPSLNNKYNWFLKASHNWNQVCNAGMIFGAFAIHESASVYCNNIIKRSIESVKLPMCEYSPSGAYPEGYAYWDYGTTFNILLIDVLEKIYNHDFGLRNVEGFMDTANYFEHMTAPSGNSFNYADCGKEYGLSPAMFWFAQKNNDPSLLWIEKDFLQKDQKERYLHNRYLPATLIWGAEIFNRTINPPTEKTWTGNGINPVALMRTSWTDPDAIYVGLKGGTASSNHAHMDAGSFIMEANGVRWAMDFGSQDYESLESRKLKIWTNTQDSERWKVFRYNNFAHNTPTVNGKLHNVNGKAEITSHTDRSGFMSATTDLTSIFANEVSSYKRGIAIVDDAYVVIKDEVIPLKNKETVLRWTMLTPANVEEIGKDNIKLTKDQKTLQLNVVCDLPVEMKTWSTQSPNDYDAPNPGTTLIGFECKVPPGRETNFDVFLLPGNTQAELHNTKPLTEWK